PRPRTPGVFIRVPAKASEPLGESPGYRIRDARFAFSSTGPVANSPQSAENADRLSTAVHRRRVRLGKAPHRVSGRLDRDFGGKLGADVARLQLEPRARVEVDVRGHERDERTVCSRDTL